MCRCVAGKTCLISVLVSFGGALCYSKCVVLIDQAPLELRVCLA